MQSNDGDSEVTDNEQAVRAVQDQVLLALGDLVELSAADDGSLSFEYAGCLCVVRVMELAAGLEMVSMTCVLAWDLPLDDALRARAEEARRQVQFGSLQVVDRGPDADVLLQYVFPAGGLDRQALATMLVLVLAGAGDAREMLLDA